MMSLLSPVLWSFLPNQITHAIIPYLNSSLPSLFPPAQKGTPTYIRNYKIAFTGVISIYLAYNFFQESIGASDPGGGESAGLGDWYSLLGVGRDVDDDGLKRAYRSLSRLHHPDRAGKGNGSSSDDTFILIRRAYETLSDPVKRYAYDRFGPSILEWKAASVREYTLTGLSNSIGFYLVSGGIMILLLLLGRAREGAFWRQTLFIALLLFELTLILSPSSSSTTASISNSSSFSLLSPIMDTIPVRLYVFNSPRFIQIQFLHKLFTTLSIAITQLAGVWAPQRTPTGEEERVGWERVIQSIRGLEMEAITSFQNEVVPLMSAGDPKNVEALIQHHMEEVLVERSISFHPQIRELWHQAQTRQSPANRSLRNQIPSSAKGAGSPISSSSILSSPLGSGLYRKGLQELDVARTIPLPPSPPPSPVLRATRGLT